MLNAVEVIDSQGDLGCRIERITHDSSQAGPGTLFVAYRGVNLDVHRFIPDALARGAEAVLVERPIAELRTELGLEPSAVLVQVASSREARALTACALYGHPSREMRVIGVTGTDGKTTTATLIHSILTAAGLRAGLVSTVAARIGDESMDTGLHVTTPEPEDLQFYLRDMHDRGAEVAVLEVTSHGLHQHRVTGIAFDIAVMTNVTDEALEYHGGFEAYRDTKALLFAMLEPADVPRVPSSDSAFDSASETPRSESGRDDSSAGRRATNLIPTAVLNAADPSHEHFRTLPGVARSTYGLEADVSVDYRATEIQESLEGLSFVLHHLGKSTRFEAPLNGRYNVSNMLAAIAAAEVLGATLEDAQAGLRSFSGIPGRMERIDAGQGFLAIVDFAHTSNGLRSALGAAANLRKPGGRLIAVFGCAGLRDGGKRAVMGAISAELADLSVLTAEDPRTEPLDEIIRAMVEGMYERGAQEGQDYVLEPDRGRAMLLACQRARAGDVVIVCGKGHEQSMCFGTTEYPWDDRRAMRAALAGEAQGGLPTSTEERE